MGQASQLSSQVAPQVYYEVKVETLKNGVVQNTYTHVNNAVIFGDPPLNGPSWNWYLSNNATDNYQTRVTITQLADVYPMRFTWTYDEVQISNPSNRFSGFSEQMDLTSGSVTQTFSASAVDRRSIASNGDVISTAFIGPR